MSILKFVFISIFCAMPFGPRGIVQQLSEVHLVLLFDRTETITNPNVENKFDKAVEALDMDTVNLSWGERTVYVSSIGQRSMQSAKTIHLDPSKSFWFRDENVERQRMRDFLTALKSMITEFNQRGTEMNKSYVNRNLFYQLDPLSQEEGKRIVLMWSDLVENGPRCNFLKYIEKPEIITQKRDSFFHIMSTDYPLPDLTGIELVNHHLPSRDFDELYEHTKRYWRTYLSQYGVKATFVVE